MKEFKVGDRIRVPEDYMGINPYRAGEEGIVKEVKKGGYRITFKTNPVYDYSSFITRLEHIRYKTEYNNEVNDKMELKNIKTTNLKEAKRQYEEEKKNAEIEYAKQQLQQAQDRIDDYDRIIKETKERKKPYEEILKAFK
jgi:hypothetical protein